MVEKKKMTEIKRYDCLEVIESLLEMTARKESEVAELKAQLDVYKPKGADLTLLKSPDKTTGKIMLVFHVKTLREILQGMLEQDGVYDVIAMDYYTDVISAFSLNAPDIVVLEHATYGEGVKSVEIISDIRQMARNVGIISIIPENDVALIREIVTAGVDDFLVKPIDTRRLSGVIHDILLKRNRKKVS
jgi:PleD family two-component response regulator